MNAQIARFLKDEFNDVRHDVFSAFMVRNALMALPNGQLGFMTPFVWMFLSSYEQLRSFILGEKTITSLIQLEYSGFDGATVPICTFTIENSLRPDFSGGYVKLSEFRGASNQGPRALEAIQNPSLSWFHRANANQFEKIPGYPISFWVSEEFRNRFQTLPSIASEFTACQGLSTADNPRFVRCWFEVGISNFCNPSRNFSPNNDQRWHAYNKGGDFRRWYGNNVFVVDWKDNGSAIKSIKPKSVVRNEIRYYKPSVSWSDITSSKSAFRLYDEGYIFANSAHSAFPNGSGDLLQAAALLNSNVVDGIIKAISPTFHFDVGYFSKLPYAHVGMANRASTLKQLSKSDWDAYETSWDFTTFPLLSPDHRSETLENSYNALRLHWHGMTDEMQRLEEENNRIYIEAYGLQDGLTPEVPIEEITLTCNPAYRFKARRGSNPTQDELDAKLRTETIKEFLSYAVGCMFGRYSLDAPGLILANQGETLEDYLAKVPEPTFEPDDDNVIPILDGDWFSDDITQRFRDFLHVTFGEEHFVENLEFIEEALGKDIRKYFLKDFYTDHVKRYKKRPIYWQFSSPKGHFNALVYMHRYRADTVSIVLNDYLRDFKAKLQAHIKSLEAITIDPSTSDREETEAGKEVDDTRKALHDIETYESDILFPLAEQQIEIDLDDGVKQNYPKFGKALKKVTGLNAK